MPIYALIRAEIAIFKYLNRKFDLFELGVNNAYLVTTGVMNSPEMFFEHFLSIFFQKISKIMFFHRFGPKFVIFQKDISGSIFH